MNALTSSVATTSIAASLAVLAMLVHCGCSRRVESDMLLTPSAVRAERRAYDGAPPVIPHPPLGASCAACHTTTGMEVPSRGFAPANPHVGTTVEGRTTNCRQCHVFQSTTEAFAESSFAGLAQDLRRGRRMYLGAPPVIPHPVLMRENCNACHSGPAARPEIRCSHPQRTNCQQCHVANQQTNANVIDIVWQPREDALIPTEPNP